VIPYWDGFTSRSVATPKTEDAARGVSPRGKCGPSMKRIPKFSPREEPPGPDVETKGKPPHGEKFPPRDVPYGNVFLPKES
jgi:hypothetical protein